MSDEDDVFTLDDRKLFIIADDDTRAIQLRDVLIPKLRRLLQVATALIEEIYEIDPYEDSTEANRPAFNPKAKKLKVYQEAEVGLWPRKTDGTHGFLKPDGTPARYGYFWLVFHLEKWRLGPMLAVRRLTELNLMFRILKDHVDVAADWFDKTGCRIVRTPFQTQNYPKDWSELDKIRRTKLPIRRERFVEVWCGIYPYPMTDPFKVWSMAFRLASLFPLYQAMMDAFLGRRERFEEYCRKYLDWVEKNTAEEDAEPEDEPKSDPGAEHEPPGRIGHSRPDPELGRRGEEFVFHEERAPLEHAGRPDLAAKVRWVANEDGDGAGYDILSYNEAGEPLYIEVKTTKSKHPATPFDVTRNEVRCSVTRSERFHLYRVYAFRIDRGEILIRKGSLRDLCDLKPTAFRASFKEPPG